MARTRSSAGNTHTQISKRVHYCCALLKRGVQCVCVHLFHTRRVRLRQEESEERATAEGQSLDTLSNSEGKASSAPTLQEELAVAQLRMQELQGDLAELREALQVTQSQLRDTETQNELMKSGLDFLRSVIVLLLLSFTIATDLMTHAWIRRTQSRCGLYCMLCVCA